ncbi:MAG: N-acetylmuramoyl-L-alanine amidase-like domain-containing protein [Elusimicrobiota bacterium]|jgi:hypothetical protein
MPASCFLVVLLASAGAAQAPERFFNMPPEEVARTLQNIHKNTPSLEGRLAAISARFLGAPYRLGPLGEGPDGEFDRDPGFDLKAVDCTTFVEETLALALRPDAASACALLQKIRYRDGIVSYTARNHFPETDWLPNNIAAGFLKDITRDVAGDQVGYVRKLISKRAWYAAKTAGDLAGFSGSSDQTAARLSRLQAAGQGFADQISTVAYVPLAAIPEVLDRIPSGAVACLVREDRPDKPVVVTHQMFIISRDGKRYVRHAASGKTVEDVPALEYFTRFAASSWRVLGINLTQPQDLR